MKQAYDEVKRALASEKHRYLSEDTLQICLEAIQEHEKRKHNGYPNYPTWLVANYIFNNEEAYIFYENLKQDLRRAEENDNAAIGVLTQTMMHDFGTEAMRLQEYCNKSFGNDNFWSSIINATHQEDIKYWYIAKTFYED